MSYPHKWRPNYEGVREVRILDLEGSNLKTNVSSGHLVLPINPNPRENKSHKQCYRVPVNKELFTGTVPVNDLFLNKNIHLFSSTLKC